MRPLRKKGRSTQKLLLGAAGIVLGFSATVASGCRETCADWDCPPPLSLQTGQYSVKNEKLSFDENQPPSSLPDLSAASLELDAETKRVTLSYVDSLGESVLVIFDKRADGGGAGEGSF